MVYRAERAYRVDAIELPVCVQRKPRTPNQREGIPRALGQVNGNARKSSFFVPMVHRRYDDLEFWVEGAAVRDGHRS